MGSEGRVADGRTRSIWLTQLVLAATVIAVYVLVLAVQPEITARWNFVAGASAILAVTIATLAVPWSRYSIAAVLVVPFLDAVAIGLMASNTDLRFSYLWAFPVMWVAMHANTRALGGILGAVAAISIVDLFVTPPVSLSAAVLRLFVVVISLSFIGITAHLAMRQMRALRRLLRRQAQRLTVTADRTSEQERRTTEILNGVDVGIMRISVTGDVLAVNDAYVELYALDPLDHRLPARSVEYTRLRGMPVPVSDRPFARSARGESFTDVRVWLFTPEGEWRVLSATSTRLGASRNEEEGMLLVVHDVTAMTQAQRERERLSAIASHEMKHPLTVMMGNAELALDDDVSPRTRERLERILAASERMLEMTKNMLQATRPTAARDDFDDIDLRAILLDSVDSFRPTASAHEVSIVTTVDGPLPAVADGFRMRQVIDNLVSNAIKYTPPEGGVRVAGAFTGDEISVVVSDSGIGIPADDLPNILTPYFRTARARETASGTGLGLGITKEIVEAHGGRLRIESTEGAGTTVTLVLPGTRVSA